MRKHVVMFSGGIGSWAAAKRVRERHDAESLILLFTDVKGNTEDPHIGEDEDTYRFIEEAAANIGGELIVLREGRNIWQVFEDKKFLGNSRLANCSHELKQKPARQWLDENCDPEETSVYVGIDWTETHRLGAIERSYAPFQAFAPLCDPPFMDKQDLIDWARSEGLSTPRLYDLGFAHNNCGGGCVRAGQAQFKKLLDLMPERFAVWEAQEEKMQKILDRPVTILSETRAGTRVPLSLRELRQRAELQPALIDLSDIGGCGCFVADDPQETA